MGGGAPSASRTNFVAVYSRAQGTVFVVGGRDGAGKIVDKISMYRFELGAWDELSLKGNLGDVIAATFSWRDGRVWIIDSDPADATHNTTRLLRVEPSTGYVEVILRTANNASGPKYDFRGLFLDMNGNVGLYASSERAQKHRVAVLHERPGGFDAQMTKRRNRTLSAQPIVDLRGVALYYGPDRLPTDRSTDAEDDTIPIDRTRAASRMRALPLVPVGLRQLEELLR